jgi:hypothetical protein
MLFPFFLEQGDRIQVWPHQKYPIFTEYSDKYTQGPNYLSTY